MKEKVLTKLFVFEKFAGNNAAHQSLDLAGSREQRGSAFELYRKPQIGNMPVHPHNVR